MSLSEFDIQISQEFPFSKIIGVDEAGRGPLAGPVTAAACYIPPELYGHPVMAKINDSKKLSPAKREKIFEELLTLPILWRTGYASAAEIDKHNILQATFIAMRRALAFFEKENAVYLGDSSFDALTARNAGIASFLVRFYPRSIPKELTPDRYVDSYKELPEVLRSWWKLTH